MVDCNCITMKWRSYLIFGLLSLVLSALSVVLWMINPFTDLLLLLAAPPLRLLGYHPPVQGWSGLGSAMLISFLWPLTLLPLHWLNFRLLRWKKWGTPLCFCWETCLSPRWC